MNTRTKWLTVLAAIALPVIAWAATVGGFPSRPKFTAVGIGQNPTSAALSITANGTTSIPSARMSGTGSNIALTETDAAANNQDWHILVNGEQWLMRVVNDAGNSATDWLVVDRTGTLIDSVNLQATAVQTNGVNITASTGSFTATFTTGCTTNPSKTFYYSKIGNTVTITPDNTTISCTSNTGSAFSTSATPVPSAIRPPASRKVALMGGCGDNGAGATTPCYIDIDTAGNMTIYACYIACSWTAANTRTVNIAPGSYAIN